jgi:predicted dehydrogenase
MAYSFGAVGFGHWFNRLYAGLKKSDEFKVTKVAGASEVNGKLEKLREIGLDESNYYRIAGGKPIPEEFFSGLDVVHVSDPNEYHAEQTIDSLKHGKYTITEKTWGVNKEEFYSVVNFIKENELADKTYLHLHYLHKKLNLDLEKMLKRYTKRHGKIRRVSTTLFEGNETEEQDARRRGWLFSPRGGGIFMDTGIHMCEVIISGAKAKKLTLDDVKPFGVRTDWDSVNATGVEAGVGVSGRYFTPEAKGTIRVAKGTGHSLRAARFYFESGAYLELHYLHSDVEYVSDKRGDWALYENGNVVESGSPRGLNNSEVFVNEIVEMCKGRNVGLTLRQVEQLFEPQWSYQEMIKNKALETSQERISAFVAEGFALK